MRLLSGVFWTVLRAASTSRGAGTPASDSAASRLRYSSAVDPAASRLRYSSAVDPAASRLRYSSAVDPAASRLRYSSAVAAETIPGLLNAAAERSPGAVWLRTDDGTLTFGG